MAFSTRLTLWLAALLLACADLIAVLGRHLAAKHDQVSLQRVLHGLAQHIVGHWPEISAVDPNRADAAACDALLRTLRVVNPGIQVCVRGADGQVAAHIGEPGRVRQPSRDLQPVRSFVAGAAIFPARAGQAHPPGYLYTLLTGGGREQVAGQAACAGSGRVWPDAARVARVGVLLTLLLDTLA